MRHNLAPSAHPRRTAAVMALLCLAFATALPAHATRKHSNGSGKIKFDKGSEESRQERDRRLSRECKGMTNAGACAGYTR